MLVIQAITPNCNAFGRLADARMCAADAGVSGESDHPSPSRACNAPLPLFKSRSAAQPSPLGPTPPSDSGYMDGAQLFALSVLFAFP